MPTTRAAQRSCSVVMIEMVVLLLVALTLVSVRVGGYVWLMVVAGWGFGVFVVDGGCQVEEW